ncbi:uncharacterized protein K489DRAFT_322884 [Dissoconium aciculare CBS 342.82]|jgi:hypothetical protein|uniref:Ubiquitin-like domain-containing protein n=1 Tax=Dissoconium aciculare CBS 342.82 TaxID=1314786 RepID=A0A6J3LZE9_9PEZI|nr:uncharacterized protein K489DRAFT_322884 [Dissoconium aciculare CBS 342.82]KAF1821033.1 hypothetical protein K489DRAFT_322884 [Dissoconium aciculare CBS 342.82]
METATERTLDIVVRFSTSNPDLVLAIASPSRTTGLALKQLIRAQLEQPAATSRLRLIHAGKVISDDAPLSSSLTLTNPPPLRNDDPNKSSKARGKLPVRDHEPPRTRLYIHCSVGDVLSASDLAIEAKSAQEAIDALDSSSIQHTFIGNEQGDASTNASTTPAPRGFDRLLSAGFTNSEVAALRAQFLAIQAHSHTPDTLPSGQELLALEERWLESGSSPLGGGGGNESGGFGPEDTGALEDLLIGDLIGFFWPIGAMFLFMREEGVWSRRRQIAVLSGFLVNVMFGFLRVMN